MSFVRGACLLLAFALGLLAACSSDPEYGDAPAGATSQVSWTMPLGAREAELIALVLDDQPSALDLRQVVASRLESYAARALSDAPACSPNDPARKRPVDRTFVVAYPSASGDARFVSPADDPNLRWREDDASPAGRAAWVAAVERALGASPEAGPFAPLATLKSLLELVSEARSAETPAESALVRSLPKPAALRVLLLAAHEDASPAEPGEYVVSLPSNAWFDTLLLPSGAPVEAPVTCAFTSGPFTPRFSAWEAQQDPGFARSWPCDGLELLKPISVDCAERCVNWRPTEEPDGRATCLLSVDAHVDHCDAALGWLDPLDEDGVRRPVVTNTATGVLRTCEIRQLGGAALESCRSTLNCTACEPGWCATEVPELLDRCTQGRPLPLRLVRGADAAVSGTVTWLCNVERVSSH